jgi:hypothetical protein
MEEGNVMRNFIKKFGLITLASLVVFSATMWRSTGIALAAAKYPTCQNTYLDLWDWVSSANGLKSQTGWTSFNDVSDSYFIYKTTTSDTNGRNQFEAVWIGGASPMTLDTVSGVDYLYHGGAVSGQITSEPTSVSAKGESWAGTPGGNWNSFSSQGKFSIGGSALGTPFKITLDSSINCVVAAHNVNTGPSWTYENFTAEAPKGTGTGQGCSLTNVSCVLSGAFDKVANTLAGIAQASFNLFAKLFAPDSATIKTSFDDLSTYISGKLGFLTYPATFLVDVFNAFTGTSSSWCSSSSCTKNFGNLFGHSFTVNFLQPNVTYPTIWAYALALIRGLTILELAIAVRRKFIKITGH